MLTFCPCCANTLYPTRSFPLPSPSSSSLTSPNLTSTFPNPSGLPPTPSHRSASGQNTLACRTCPYQFLISRTYFERKEMKRKEVEDVMGGKEAWANVDVADAQCPHEGCEGGKAFFYQVQIRSADEPMTTFYKCTTCAQRWKEN